VVDQTVLDLNDQIRQSEDILDNIYKVIERPAMIFKTSGDAVQLYYFRAIGWHRTILIQAKQTDQHFHVAGYQLDPSLQQISQLQSTAQRLI